MEFYRAAFGAVEVYRFGGTDDLEEVVAQLAVGNSMFWVEDESPPDGNFSPETVGGATSRMLIIVDDPRAVLTQAVAAGALEVGPVGEEHGWELGGIDDPFGHRWEIAKPLGDWPPPDPRPGRASRSARATTGQAATGEVIRHPPASRAKSSQSPGMPLSWWTPRSTNTRPDPTVRSRTVRETTTSPGPACPITRAAR